MKGREPLRKMSLSEFGWKLCLTAVLILVASWLASVSLFFMPDRLHLSVIPRVAFLLSMVAALLGVLLAIAGHAINLWRRRHP